jgi:hypothetical protein
MAYDQRRIHLAPNCQQRVQHGRAGLNFDFEIFEVRFEVTSPGAVHAKTRHAPYQAVCGSRT